MNLRDSHTVRLAVYRSFVCYVLAEGSAQQAARLNCLLLHWQGRARAQSSRTVSVACTVEAKDWKKA